MAPDGDTAALKTKGLSVHQLGLGSEYGVTALEVIGFIAMYPTHLYKNTLIVQRICHM